MAPTSIRSKNFVTRDQSVRLQLVRPGATAEAVAWPPVRPAWIVLYLVMLSTALGLIGVDIMLPVGGGRTITRLLTVSAGMAVAWVWLRCNRTALMLSEVEGQSEAEMPVEVSLVRRVRQ